MNRPDLTLIPAGIAALRRRALMIGVAGLAACALGWWLNPERFFQGYLTAWLFWSGLSLGSLALLMLQHLTGGAWGLMIRRPLEAAMRSLPVTGLMFLPLLLGMGHLYEWAQPDLVAADPILLHKAPYLNVTFFIGRAALFFAVWIILSLLLGRMSDRQDRQGSDARSMARFQIASGPGLVLFALTMTFASVDWIMSLDPHWYSSMFAPLIMVGYVVGALALSLVVVIHLAGSDPLASVLRPRHVHDLGKLLLAFVMVWAYFAFSQFLIIWAGNLPEEIPWYMSRLHGGWEWAALGLLLLHFVVPFMLLLSRSLKRDFKRLGRVALLVLVMHFVDLYWLVNPAFDRALTDFHWLDLAAVAGLGGVWLATFLGRLGSHPLLPVKDPHLLEALDHDAH